MFALTLIALCAASVCEFLGIVLSAPIAYVKFVPELLSATITVAVLLEGMRKGFGLISGKYWAAFGIAVFIIVCAFFANSEEPGPVVAGMRQYLRAMPMFLIPAVFPFTEKQTRLTFKVLLYIALAQVPIACYQRYVIWAAGRFSGDDVRGTATDSGILSIFLVAAVVVWLAYFMRKEVTRGRFIGIFLLLLLPTMINETKATVVLLPLGLLATVVAGSASGQRMKVFFMALALLVVVGAIMVPVYDYFAQNNPYKNERHLLDFFTDQKQMDTYMNTKGGTGIGSHKLARRGDAVRVPVEYLAKDPVKLAFGLGLGNASHSNLGEQFTGRYYDLFQAFAYISFSIFLLEIGLLGTLIVFLLYAMVFFDAIYVARHDTNKLTGPFAVGYIGVVAVFGAATFYAALHAYAILSYLYWYTAGVVAARRVQLQQEARAPARPTFRDLRRQQATAASIGFVPSRNNQNRLDQDL
ncbi:MAG: hypothetical protein JSR66_15650 [Proteobacteria bacterium]|nr:hypothetical protein [Pseudomonadota bacterium]